MSNENTTASLSIMQLPEVVTHLLTRTHHPLLTDTKHPLALAVRYLRRKPKRGLAVIYNVYAVRNGKRAKKQQAHDLYHALSLTLGEQALEGSRIRYSQAEAQQATFAIQPSGVLWAEKLGLAVQAFPADDSLPALATCCSPMAHPALRNDMQAAVQRYLGDQNWHIVAANVVPIRYKPASRCVFRYNLTLENCSGTVPQRKDVTIFGKVYADRQQASAVQALQQQLYQEQLAGYDSILLRETLDRPFLPQPLGLHEALGVTFNEAVQPATPGQALRTGVRAFQPSPVYGRGGEFVDVVIPTRELQLAAIALARLHSSTISIDKEMLRSGAKEAKRALERAQLIAGAYPEQAQELHRLAQLLATRLEKQQPDVYRPAHGGFKASQLLFHSDRVFVVDFDGVCLADTALDIGYFLAYLRPSGLWYGRPGMRQWFEASAQAFTQAYRQAMLELNVDKSSKCSKCSGCNESSVDESLKRARLYEAALLFKIATRRVNRLNSPRPKELSAMLQEIASCLSNEPQ